MSWSEYTNGRKISKNAAGFSVIVPNEPLEAQPIFCPHCDKIMNTYYDVDAWRKFQCCDECAARWVYPDLEKWKSGWRPSASDKMGRK